MVKKKIISIVCTGVFVILVTNFTNAGSNDNDLPKMNVIKRIEMKETGYLDSEQGRELLKYLVSCALPEDVELYANIGGTEYNFQGSMNLAPGWIKNELTESEERWVSACILGRTNYYGRKVQISMQAKQSPHKYLQTTSKEEKEFSIYEGDFFGNIFLDKAEYYTCIGDRTAEDNSNGIFDLRVCTEIDNTLSHDNTITKCGFVFTGFCGDKDSHIVNDHTYNEVISVYLKPE